MRKNVLLGAFVAVIAVLGFTMAADAQTGGCRGVRCNLDSCTDSQGDEQINCCCSITYQVTPTGTVKVCSSYCSRKCGQTSPCLGANCAECAETSAAGTGFKVTNVAASALAEEHLVSSLVLRNVMNKKASEVYSQVVEGAATTASGEQFFYRARITANPGRLVFEYVFSPPTAGAPLRQNSLRVEIDEYGNSFSSSLPEPMAQQIKEWTPPVCEVNT